MSNEPGLTDLTDLTDQVAELAATTATELDISLADLLTLADTAAERAEELTELITPTCPDLADTTHRSQILDALHDYTICVALLDQHLDHTLDELVALTLVARARPHLDTTTATLVATYLATARSRTKKLQPPPPDGSITTPTAGAVTDHT